MTEMFQMKIFINLRFKGVICLEQNNTRTGGNPHHQLIMGWIQTPTGNQRGGYEITDPTSVNLLKTAHNIEHVEVRVALPSCR